MKTAIQRIGLLLAVVVLLGLSAGTSLALVSALMHQAGSTSPMYSAIEAFAQTTSITTSTNVNLVNHITMGCSTLTTGSMSCLMVNQDNGYAQMVTVSPGGTQACLQNQSTSTTCGPWANLGFYQLGLLLRDTPGSGGGTEIDIDITDPEVAVLLEQFGLATENAQRQFQLSIDFLTLASNASSLSTLKTHVQQSINVLVGENDSRFDTSVGNPGDGVGTINYMQEMCDLLKDAKLRGALDQIFASVYQNLGVDTSQTPPSELIQASTLEAKRLAEELVGLLQDILRQQSLDSARASVQTAISILNDILTGPTDDPITLGLQAILTGVDNPSNSF